MARRGAMSSSADELGVFSPQVERKKALGGARVD
jgi:hypothetical protein